LARRPDWLSKTEVAATRDLAIFGFGRGCIAAELDEGGDMDADLVLEGGGVKGIALVGALSKLEEAGYTFRRVAGTSAGAIVGSMVAAAVPIAELEKIMRTIDYTRFRDPGALDRLGPLGEIASVWAKDGLYLGDFLKSWLEAQLGSSSTFAQLRYTEQPDEKGVSATTVGPDASRSDIEQRYRFVAMTSDVSRGVLVRLPWDYPAYGVDPDAVPVAEAVRMSMSIPIFYRPVHMRYGQGNQDSWFVDGGMLSNFPITVFDRQDGQAPRWPTFGIKLSSKETNAAPLDNNVHDFISFVRALAETATGFYDRMHLDDPCVERRTIFVDTMGVPATRFDIDPVTQGKLFDNGQRAADQFLQTWDFNKYQADCGRHAPTSG
jgi:NTE family protein